MPDVPVYTLPSAPDAIWRGIVDLTEETARATITHVTEDVPRITGYSEANILGQAHFWERIAHEGSRQLLQNHYKRLRRDQVVILPEFVVIADDGSELTIELRTQRLREISPNRFEVLGSISLPVVAGVEVAIPQPGEVGHNPEDTIRHLAFHDTLTDLPNRLLLEERLSDALETTNKGSRETAVLFIDLDGFKTVNDTLGHQAGDTLLVHVAQRLRESVRTGDLVARFGGDEFVVVLTRIVGNDAERIAEKILRSLTESVDIDGRDVYVGASIGIAIAPRDGATPEELLRNADNALYRAKDAGRGTVRVYTPTMHLLSSARLLMESSLRKAITKNELFLEYQPIYDAVSGDLVTAEALIRWRHPLRDTVYPQEFIPLAEEAGIIEELGRWIVQTACAQVVHWQREGLKVPIISLNVSVREFRHKPFVTHLLESVHSSGTRPNQYQLELTESVTASNNQETISKLLELRDAGFNLALDDFGKGHSSLSQLQSLPFSGLKVDHSFTREVGSNPRHQAILRAIIGLGHTFGMSVCVEGVETEAQAAFLRTAGCDTMQGYFLSRPVGVQAFTEVLRQRK